MSHNDETLAPTLLVAPLSPQKLVNLTPEIENNSRMLVAKLFTKRRVNIEALSRTLRSMWRFVQNFEVRDLGANTVLILFESETNPPKILAQGPWSFDKYLIGLYKPKEEELVDNATFTMASFWIQSTTFHFGS